MSVSGSTAFDVETLPIDRVDDGTSILLTGDDTEALKTVFSRIVAADEDERSIVLATNAGGRAVRRTLRNAKSGAGDRASVLTCEGPDHDDAVTTVDDIGDLTRLGMEFSSLVAASQQSTARFRAGIFLCSTICSEVEDTRSVFRFLNTNFLTELRRGEGIGVCAIDTSADLETDINSMISGMETSFSARIDIKVTGRTDATLTVSGLSGVDETVDVTL
ncbi:hypothetical protein D8Y22_02330 [Salinadaptatus halalkaliphilus]|uniref:Uncharacterized protein n=1 Tax=Salinadaptatus halalkaliphilus TaxID=2419781 RepID=A0A4S3TUR9_9EURY|nr:hypothetical protein [Salinadaptatus halalkaliphilus]THE66418.1 hypothetical protein D8Y22_02330 [Salinadaptatus halalkaliphilus]